MTFVCFLCICALPFTALQHSELITNLTTGSIGMESLDKIMMNNAAGQTLNLAVQVMNVSD